MNIFKNEKLHLFKVWLSQALSENNFDQKSEFCEMMMKTELPFGLVNMYNFRYCSRENGRTQYSTSPKNKYVDGHCWIQLYWILLYESKFYFTIISRSVTQSHISSNQLQKHFHIMSTYGFNRMVLYILESM